MTSRLFHRIFDVFHKDHSSMTRRKAMTKIKLKNMKIKLQCMTFKHCIKKFKKKIVLLDNLHVQFVVIYKVKYLFKLTLIHAIIEVKSLLYYLHVDIVMF